MRKPVCLVLLLCCLGVALARPGLAMTPAEKKRLDTFCSNFSEAALPGFAAGGLSEAAMRDFALRHATRNAYKSLKKAKDGRHVLVPAALVDTITEKYFGVRLARHGQVEYPVPEASGEAYVFSQATSLAALGNDQFAVEGVIYAAGSGGTPDPHGTPAQWKKAGEDVEKRGTFTARLRSVGDRYILLEYAPREKTDLSVAGCAEKVLATVTVAGVYRGNDCRADDFCKASVKTDAGKVVRFRCGEDEARRFFGTAPGRRVAAVAEMRQFWNEPAGACDRDLFCASGKPVTAGQ
jgi:hypothetical protein